MKRIALLTVFFYACTFAAPQPSRAVLPAVLALIPAAAVGEQILALSSIAAVTAAVGGSMYFYQDTSAIDPIYAAYQDALAAGDDAANNYLYQPAKLAWQQSLVTPSSFPDAEEAYIGMDAHLGVMVSDFVTAVQNSADGLFPNSKSLIEANSDEPATLTSVSPTVGSVVTTESDQMVSITGVPSTQSMNYRRETFDAYMMSISGVQRIAGWNLAYWHSAQRKIYAMSDSVCQVYQGNTYYWVYIYGATAVTAGDPLSVPPPPINFPGLQDALSSNPGALGGELPDVIKTMPASQVKPVGGAIPSSAPTSADAPTITNADVKNFYAANSSNVYNEYLNVANNADSTTNEILGAKAAAENAKQAEDAAEPDAETFSPISDSPFGMAYSPGPYDIPTRFNNFLSNVKTSGLFSFSSAFFESLPGGGTSTYTVDAGIYGTHTIDLSDTMSGGLAVLKTILLVVFGFLSIRAVIMKR